MVTAGELLNDPKHRYNELIVGRIRPLNLPMTMERSLAVTNWFVNLGLHVVPRELGWLYGVNVGFFLKRDPDTVKAPDFAFIKQERQRPVIKEGFVLEAPSLVVESSQDDALPDKVSEWLTFGIPYVIDLNAASETLVVHRPHYESVTLTRADSFSAVDLLPGFLLPLEKVFQKK
jgi:Uma2 family endonuclease